MALKRKTLKLSSANDLSLLFLRVAVGSLLAWEAQAVLLDPASLARCAELWARVEVTFPEFVAATSVLTQLFGGLLLLAGMLTRFAGVFTTLNQLVVGGLMHSTSELASVWPLLLVILIVVHFVLRGGGRHSVDFASVRLARQLGLLPRADHLQTSLPQPDDPSTNRIMRAGLY